MNKKYQKHHIEMNISDIHFALSKPTIQTDYRVKKKQLKKIIKYMDEHLVTTYQDFIQIFIELNFRQIDQIEMINSLLHHIQSIHADKIETLKKRELNKSNKGERNIVLNRIAYQFPDEFIQFVDKYLKNFYKGPSNLVLFMDKLKSLVDRLVYKEEKNEFFDENLTNDFEMFDYETDVFFGEYTF